MAGIVAEKLGLTKKQVLEVYKATGEALPAALAEHKRVEIHGWLVGALTEVPGKAYKIKNPQTGDTMEGVSSGFLRLRMKPHRPICTKIQILTGQSVKG